MLKQFEEKLVETLKRTSSFKGFSNNILSFEIDRINKDEGKYFKYNFSIELTYKEDIPLFKIINYQNSEMRSCGHTYSDGVLCHNIPSYKATPESGEWYGTSIVQFVNSLEQKRITNQFNQTFNILVSSLPENDIVEYERIAHGTFYVLSDSTLAAVIVGNKYALMPSNDINVRVPGFIRITNINFSGHHWTVTKKVGNIISLSIEDKIVEAVFQPTTILIEENANIAQTISIIGAGSLGSYFISNYAKDYLNGTMNIIDGDIYLYENSKRHYLGLNPPSFFGNKGAIMAKVLERDLLRHGTQNKIVAFTSPIGLRVSSNGSALAQKAIDSSDVIVDLTGRNEPLQFLMQNVDLKNTSVYKAALYDSGNVMVVANVNVDLTFEEIINEWNDKRIKLGYEPDSAYSSVSPANNSRVSMCAGVLNELIANKTIEKGDYFIYDWRRNFRKTE